MNVLTLESCKAQCRIEGDDEDDLLTIYAEAAEETIFTRINRTYDECIEEYSEMPAPLKYCMLVLVAQMYKYRELTTQDAINRVPGTFWDQLLPYIKLTNTTDNE